MNTKWINGVTVNADMEPITSYFVSIRMYPGTRRESWSCVDYWELEDAISSARKLSEVFMDAADVKVMEATNYKCPIFTSMDGSVFSIWRALEGKRVSL